MQGRLESVLEGPSSNLASKRPKLSYSASSLAEDKKNFLYTLMGELLQQRRRARDLSLAKSSCIQHQHWKKQAARRTAFWRSPQKRSSCQSTSGGCSRRYLHRIHCTEGFKLQQPAEGGFGQAPQLPVHAKGMAPLTSSKAGRLAGASSLVQHLQAGALNACTHLYETLQHPSTCRGQLRAPWQSTTLLHAASGSQLGRWCRPVSKGTASAST